MKSTMSRYMDPGVADQLLEGGGEDILGGKATVATILFSDVRGFTTLTEELGAQGTVTLLNDYFTIMMDCISKEEGLPIRLTPMTATCRVPPLSRVKLGIGWSRGVARDAEQ